MKNSAQLTVVIVTKNRARDLAECLESLAQQTRSPQYVVVVDNNSSDDTEKVVARFRRTVKFQVRRVLETGWGYPKIYNRGIEETKTNWVAFIDDDCVARADWLEQIETAISKHPKAAAILGFSDSYYDKNVYSLATFFFNFLWKENGSRGQEVSDPEILDNKNIVYSRRFLDLHHIRYDEQRIQDYGGASEDCDLGRQIATHRGKAVYIKDIQIWHKDPRTFWHYVNKTIIALKAYQTYRAKWQLSMADGQKKLRVRQLLPQFIRDHELGIWQALFLTGVVGLTIVIKKTLIFTLRWK